MSALSNHMNLPEKQMTSAAKRKGKKNDRQDCGADVLHRRCTYVRRNHAPVYGYVRKEE